MNLYLVYISFLICFSFNHSNSACMEDGSPSSSPQRLELNSGPPRAGILVPRPLFKRAGESLLENLSLEEQPMDTGFEPVSRHPSLDSLNPAAAAACPPRKGCSFDCSMMSARAHQLFPSEGAPMPSEGAPMEGYLRGSVKRAGDPLQSFSIRRCDDNRQALAIDRHAEEKKSLKHRLFNLEHRPASASPKSQHSTRADLFRKSFTP